MGLIRTPPSRTRWTRRVPHPVLRTPPSLDKTFWEEIGHGRPPRAVTGRGALASQSTWLSLTRSDNVFQVSAAMRADDEEVTRVLLDLAALGQSYGAAFGTICRLGKLLVGLCGPHAATRTDAPPAHPPQVSSSRATLGCWSNRRCTLTATRSCSPRASTRCRSLPTLLHRLVSMLLVSVNVHPLSLTHSLNHFTFSLQDERIRAGMRKMAASDAPPAGAIDVDAR